MSFYGSEENLKKIWLNIPEDLETLVTHGPLNFIGDYVNEIYTGSESLLDEVLNRIKPMYHISGIFMKHMGSLR